MKIDGVDVSKCKYLHEDMICGKFCTHCEQNPNCYFKQLKQKEKEIEVLKAKNELIISNVRERYIKINRYDDLQEQFNRLSIKNKQYKQTIDEIKGKCTGINKLLNGVTDSDYNLGRITTAQQILLIINEVEE